MEHSENTDVAFLSTVHKSLTILELLNDSPNINTSEISRATTFSRPSVQRVLHTLQKLGYIVRDEKSKRFRPTDRVLKLSMGYTFSNHIAAIAAPIIQSTSRHIPWPIILTRPNGLELEVLATTQTKNPFAIQKLSAGHRIPLKESATGRVYLASSSKQIRENYLTLMSQSETEQESMAAFKADIQRAQRQRFAFFQKKGELEKSLAVPITTQNECCAGLVVRFISSAVKESEAVKNLVPALTSTASIISHELDQNAQI